MLPFLWPAGSRSVLPLLRGVLVATPCVLAELGKSCWVSAGSQRSEFYPRCCTTPRQRSAGCSSGRRPEPPSTRLLCGGLKEEERSWTWPLSGCR